MAPILDDKGRRVQLVKLRDPYGTDRYNSSYSDSSELWTSEAMRNRAGSVVANDGEFFMPIKLYFKHFGFT